MSDINTTAEGIVICRESILRAKEGVDAALAHLLARMKEAAAEWDDESYRQLEDIVGDCVEAVKTVYPVMLDASAYLDSLIRIVEEYDSVFSAGTVGGAAGSAGGSTVQGTDGGRFFTDDVISGNAARAAGFIPGPEPEGVPRSLQRTEQMYREMVIDGQNMSVYDDPIGTYTQLIKVQGHSSYPMGGSCGLCQCANLLTMAGVQTTEDQIISCALNCSPNVVEGLELSDPDPSERGGTSASGRQEILNRCGLSTFTLPVDENRAETIHTLAAYIQRGHGVIVSVDVERLWRNGQSGGHAISLLSVTEDGSYFIYSDTGTGRMDVIPAAELAAALSGRPANITDNIIR
ncbi:MAG: hypothetical protein IJH99_07040 [Eubacterium sp.]|nr:hypothetical protein [Eubacterium sp.]